MKLRPLLWWSVALNAALLAVVVARLQRPAPPALPAPSSSSADPVQRPAAVAGPPQIVVRTTVRTNAFHWSQVESTNYQAYIANLRAVGCPEQTIRDIIVADLAKTYAERRAWLRLPPGPFEFWATREQTEPGPARQATIAAQARELDLEMRAAVKELLGVDLERTRPEAGVVVEDLVRRLEFLPSAKQEQVRAVRERYAGLEQKIKSMSETQVQPDGLELLQRYQQMKAELQQVMTPEEYERYDMSTSWTGDNLRKGMVGFNPTEEEFRALFRLWRVQDENLAEIYQTGQPDPGKEHVFEAIRQVLGEERYREYRRSWWNHEFHGLVTFLQDQDLPAGVPGRVHDLKAATEDQLRQVDANAAVPENQRQFARSQVLNEAGLALRNWMNPAAYERYQSSQYGSWLRSGTRP